MAIIQLRKTTGGVSGTEFQVEGNSGHRYLSNSYANFDVGAILNVSGHLDVDGQLNILGAGDLNVGGTETIQAGGTLTTEGDATVAWAGTSGHPLSMSWNAYTSMADAGTWSHSATHTVTGAAGVWNFSSGGNIAGDPLFKNADVTVDNNSSWTQQCPIDLSGNLGFVNHRDNGGDVLTDGTVITVTQQDVWRFTQPNIDGAKLTLSGVTGRTHRFTVIYTPASTNVGWFRWNSADRVKFPAGSGRDVVIKMIATGTTLQIESFDDPGNHAERQSNA